VGTTNRPNGAGGRFGRRRVRDDVVGASGRIGRWFSCGAVDAVAKARDAVRRGRASDARSFAVAAAVMADKAVLLSGGATSRTESLNLNADAEWWDRQKPSAAQIAADERAAAELDRERDVLMAQLEDLDPVRADAVRAEFAVGRDGDG
jgi:hypothetical protein